MHKVSPTYSTGQFPTSHNTLATGGNGEEIFNDSRVDICSPRVISSPPPGSSSILPSAEKSTIQLEIDPKLFPPRRGGHCKISALAHLDALNAKEYGVKEVPLLSLKTGKRSIRKIAKEHNSVQGEVLQKQDLCEIAKEIGYKTQILQCPDLKNFRDTIYQCLEKNNPPLVVYPTFSDGTPFEAYPPESCEHAALIVGLDPNSEVTLAHWQKTYEKISLSELYDSMQSLKSTRSQESYLNIWKKNGTRSLANPVARNSDYKYPDVSDDLSDQVSKYRDQDLLKSIFPARNTGFKNSLFSFAPDLSHPRWQKKSSEEQMPNIQPFSISTDARNKISKSLKECLYDLHEKHVRTNWEQIVDNVSSIYRTDLSVDPRVRKGFEEKYAVFNSQLSYLKDTQLGQERKTPDERKALIAIIDELVDQLLTEPTTPPVESQQFHQWLKQNEKEFEGDSD